MRSVGECRGGCCKVTTTSTRIIEECTWPSFGGSGGEESGGVERSFVAGRRVEWEKRGEEKRCGEEKSEKAERRGEAWKRSRCTTKRYTGQSS